MISNRYRRSLRLSIVCVVVAMSGCAELNRQGLIMADNYLSEPYEKPQIIVRAVPEMQSIKKLRQFERWLSQTNIDELSLLSVELEYPNSWNSNAFNQWRRALEKNWGGQLNVIWIPQHRSDVLATTYKAKASVLGCDTAGYPALADSKTGYSKQFGCSDVRNLVAMTPNPLVFLSGNQYLPGVNVQAVGAVIRFNSRKVEALVSPQISAGGN